jgi:predicted AlkP superfamily pyrophosphatase or phosphodiesterase
MSPMIVVMLDGVAARHLHELPLDTPHLRRLAERGLYVERLAPERPATSLPGRTSILTGVDPSEHTITGNLIWDGSRFRYANPDDVAAPTLNAHALAAGREVAVFGYGMVRPEAATTFVHAWWANEMLQRARDEAPIPADEGWLRTSRHRDGSGRMHALAALGLPREPIDAYAGGRVHYRLAELVGDQQMMRWSAAALAHAPNPPDLTLTEVLVPDSLQHRAGEGHPFTAWAIGYADALLGELLATLAGAERLANTTVVVLSDHGHGRVDEALYLDTLLPGVPCAAEGGTLFVKVDGARARARLRTRLAADGIASLPDAPLPPALRDELAVFAAPVGPGGGGVVFSRQAPEGYRGAVRGPAPYRSGHGFAPGTPSDDRFMLIVGPGIAPRRIAHAAAADVATTLAALLGLPPLGRGRVLV